VDQASLTSTRDRNIAAGCALLLLIGMPIAYLTDNPSTGDVIGLVVITLICLALMAWIVLRLVPRQRAEPTDRATRTALILGVLALVACVVFWTGLPFPFGAGAIGLGVSLRSALPAGGRGKATAAVALGTFAVVASFVVLLVG
jgi:peptidoglycan/LPS O-acetylase OafA/YrhL